MNQSKKYDFRSALDFTRTQQGNGRPLAMCMEKIAYQQQLLRSVRAALPTHMAEHTLHCVLNDARLLIYTHSAVWASQIRFYQDDILTKLQADAQLKIARIHVKILHGVVEPVADKPLRLPGFKTVQAILGGIDDTSDDVLDLALANLAKTLLRRLNS